MDKEHCLQEVLAIWTQRGHEPYFNEPVTHLQHAVQCAENALKASSDPEVVIACLLHDIGHICVAETPTNTIVAENKVCGIKKHEFVGGDYLRSRGFSEKVCLLVESHSSAKRYLASKFPDYFQLLSYDSKNTLMIDQGGLMTPQELQDYEKSEHFEGKVTVRRCDDTAKNPDIPCSGLSPEFIQMMKDHLAQQ